MRFDSVLKSLDPVSLVWRFHAPFSHLLIAGPLLCARYCCVSNISRHCAVYIDHHRSGNGSFHRMNVLLWIFRFAYIFTLIAKFASATECSFEFNQFSSKDFNSVARIHFNFVQWLKHWMVCFELDAFLFLRSTNNLCGRLHRIRGDSFFHLDVCPMRVDNSYLWDSEYDFNMDQIESDR